MILIMILMGIIPFRCAAELRMIQQRYKSSLSVPFGAFVPNSNSNLGRDRRNRPRTQTVTQTFLAYNQQYSEPDRLRRQQQSYSMNDLINKGSEREYPPMLDSMTDDVDFNIVRNYIDEADNQLLVEDSLQRIVLSDIVSDSAKSSPRSDKKQSSSSVPIPEGYFDDLDAKIFSNELNQDDQVMSTTTASSDKSNKIYVQESLQDLEEKFNLVTTQIYALNNGVVFNINSSKQVSEVIFGTPDQSTSKDALESYSISGNHPLAALILEYRSLKNRISSMKRRESSIKKGTAVNNAVIVAKPKVDSKGISAYATTNEIHKEEMTDPLILVDASSYIFRAYYTMPPIHRSDGMPIGAVMGFCKMMNSMFLTRMLDQQLLPPRVVMCFDAKGKTFRHEMYPNYKANRPPAPMDLIPQFDLVRQAAAAYGICQIEAPSYEADDVIATLATMALAEGLDTNILSGDKDLMQLVTSPQTASEASVKNSIQIIDPVKKERTTYHEVIEKWAVPPARLGDVLALAGDTADNVPGVPGIGPKIAAALINEYGSLDNLLNNLDKIPQQKRRETLQNSIELARISRRLVELNREVPQASFTGFPDDDFSVGSLRMERINFDRLMSFYDEMGFKELKRTLLQRLKGLKQTRSPSTYRSQQRSKSTIPRPEDYADIPF